MAERLSPEDSRILALESSSIVGHTCKVVIAERTGDGVTYLRDRIARRIALAPSCRRRIVMIPTVSTRRCGQTTRTSTFAGTSVRCPSPAPSEMQSCARSSPV